MYKDTFTHYAKLKEINFEDLKNKKKEKLKGLLKFYNPIFSKRKVKKKQKKLFYIGYKPNFIMYNTSNFNNYFTTYNLNNISYNNEFKHKNLKIIKNRLKEKTKLEKKTKFIINEKEVHLRNLFLRVGVLNNFKRDCDSLLFSLKLQYRKKKIKKLKNELKLVRILLLKKNIKNKFKKRCFYFANNKFISKKMLKFLLKKNNNSLKNDNFKLLFSYLKNDNLKRIILLDSFFKNTVCFLVKNTLKFYNIFPNLRLTSFLYNLRFISFDKLKTITYKTHHSLILLNNKSEIIDKLYNLLIF
jgi:hypothetical protein